MMKILINNGIILENKYSLIISLKKEHIVKHHLVVIQIKDFRSIKLNRTVIRILMRIFGKNNLKFIRKKSILREIDYLFNMCIFYFLLKMSSL